MDQSVETTHQGSSKESKTSDVLERSDDQSTGSNVNIKSEDPSTTSNGVSGEAGVSGVSGDTCVKAGVDGEAGKSGGLSEEEIGWWSAVKENPSDFTSWTYLLQRIERKVKIVCIQSTGQVVIFLFLLYHLFCDYLLRVRSA